MSRAGVATVFLIVVTLVGCGEQNPSPQGAATVSNPPASAAPPATQPAPAAVPAPLSTSTSTTLPPLPQVPFAPARPMEVVEAVFRFAAEHPEVLSKIPCFCGCENRGHRHNDDCFVAARDQRGAVTAWEPHGIG